MIQRTAHSLTARLTEKIHQRTARVGVIGLGYVGLPLAVEFAKRGYATTGLDLNPERVKTVQAGRSHIPDVPGSEVKALVASGALRATTRYAALRALDAVIICVPTPLKKGREPDLSCLIGATEALARHLHPGQVIVMESTTFPGTTEEVVRPRLEATGLRVGADIFLGFSPERIDPGNSRFSTTTIPKIISGVTPQCREIIQLLYEQVIRQVVPVSSTRVAEMVKLLENTFRCVNIGLANEVALLCHRLGVDVWEVIEAAKTKPFGFMPFYPGPGLGGHCIPIDPLYLSWKAKVHGFESRFIELASQVNASMPDHVVTRVAQALNERGVALNGSRILVLGVAYKREVNDVRESPALEILHRLRASGARVQYHDPLVPTVSTNGDTWSSVPLRPAALRAADCVLVVTDHRDVDYRAVLQHARLVVDTRNALQAARVSLNHGSERKLVRL